MSRRPQRVANLIRQTLGEVILGKLADPRIDPARTSVTRVEMTEDLLTAKVYVSVMGDEARKRRTLEALGHAAGHLQELMMRQISLRHTPILSFEYDVRYKKTLETLEIIQQAMDEIHDKERLRQEQSAPAGTPDGPDTSAPPQETS